MSNHDILRQNLVQLRAPVNDQDTLLQLLSTSLEALDIRRDFGESSHNEPKDLRTVLHYIPEYQTSLLENVVPHWEDSLRESGKLSLVTEYFIPRKQDTSDTTAWMESIISAYFTLTSHITLQISVDILAELTREVTPLDVFQYLMEKTSSADAIQRWSDYLKSMLTVPGKVSNAAAIGKLTIPEELETG